MGLLDNLAHIDSYLAWYDRALILQAINALHHKRVQLYKTIILSAHILQRILSSHSCTYTHACDDHARIKDYNDGIHCECMTNYGFTHVIINSYEMSLT